MGVAGPTPVRSLFLYWSSMAMGAILTQEPAGAKCGGPRGAIENGRWRGAQDGCGKTTAADAPPYGEVKSARARSATGETFCVRVAYLVAREVSDGSTDASDEA